MINNNSQLKLILKDFTNIWNQAYELMIQRTNKAFQIIPEVPFYSFDEILDEEFFPRITMATKDKKTYFGLKIKNEDDFFGVLESDIKKLPFYNFWKTKVIHTKIYSKNGKVIEDFVSLESWENFSKHFIEDGLSYCSH